MLYVTGDIHGEFRFVKECIPNIKELTEKDIIFVTGDFGYLFLGNKVEEYHLDKLEKLPFLIAFVDGNHENFPLIFSYPEEEWCGGRIHRIRKNVIHLMRGQVYDVPNGEGKIRRIFTMGGAYSIDKAMRQEGYSWWPEEMPSEEEYEEARKNLARVDYQVDVVLSHALPEESMNIFHPYHPHEQKLNVFLEWVRESTKYKHWFCGHLHRDEDIWKHITILFRDVRNMETNESFLEETSWGN